MGRDGGDEMGLLGALYVSIKVGSAWRPG
jgi:hypothetical protein